MLKRFKRIYVNGCSLTAGSGLESNDVKRRYKELHNIEYQHEKDLTYPKYLGEFFECPVVNDAKSGTGSPRLIRRTYEFIREIGIEEAKKTLFILQVNNAAHRVETFSNEIRDYLVINPKYNLKTGVLESVDVTDNWSGTDGMYGSIPGKYNEMNEYFNNHISKFHDPFVYENKIADEFIGLISFLESLKIEYYYLLEMTIIQSNYFDQIYSKLNKKRQLFLEGEHGISPFTTNRKLNINDDTNNVVSDTHPGILGHKLVGETLIKVLTEKLTQTVWVFGDSYSESFEALSMKYKSFEDYVNYKGYVPKNYVDFLESHFGYKIKNYAKSGSSNATILKSFLNVSNQINPEDIIIINWSSTSRFRVSSNDGDFWDIVTTENVEPTEGLLSQTTLEEMKINRLHKNVFFKEILEYIDVVQKICPNNYSIFWTWDFPYDINNDATINQLKNTLLTLRPFEKIIEETNSKINDHHYSEDGHNNLFLLIKDKIEKKYQKGKLSLLDRIFSWR